MTRTAYQKEVLTTGDVARICHVAPRTVSKWFDSGQLRGYRIPGSRDRRIPIEQLIAFMQANGLPLEGLDGRQMRVLLVGAGIDGDQIEAIEAAGGLEVRTADNGFEAGVLARQFHPHAIVLDLDAARAEGLMICRNVKANMALQGTVVIAAIGEPMASTRQELLAEGFDACLSKPYSAAELGRAVAEAVNTNT